MKPLPSNRNTDYTNNAKKANTGLKFNKFVDQWPDLTVDDKLDGIKDKKKDWLEKFNGKSLDASCYAKRVKAIADSRGGLVENLITTGPFSTGIGLPHGVENGFLWHHTFGFPYLPASSIKGMIRAWIKDWLNEKTRAGELFGRDDQNDPSVGRIIIHDAIPTGSVTLYTEIITPHSGDWRLTGTTPPSDWISPKPIPFLAVKQCAEFQFAISPKSNAQGDDLKDAFKYLKEGLEWIGVGAKTAVGFGRFTTQEGIQRAKQDADEAQAKLDQERKRLISQAPLDVGDKANHDEWGCVEVKKINGDMADVYSIDEAEDRILPLSELKKR